MDGEQLEEILEVLESLDVDELPVKAKEVFLSVIGKLRKIPHLDREELFKVQDDLELLSSMPNIDSYTRNEIMNVLSTLEGISF